MILVMSATSLAQESRLTSQESVEEFALRLVAAGPQERSELLAKRKELITADLRKELVSRGNMLLIGGRYSPALDVYVLAQDVSLRIGDREGIAATALNIGTVYYFQGNYVLAAEQYQKARGVFTEVGNKTEAAKSIFGMAMVYKEQRNQAEALNSFSQALKEFESLGNKEEMANSLNSIGAIYYARGDYPAASQAFRRSIELVNNAESELRIADALYMQHDYAQALAYYQNALQKFERERNLAATVSALGSIANSYYYQGNYDLALEYYQKTLVLDQKLGETVGQATQLQGMGNVYRARGDFGSALESYFKSLALTEQASAKTTSATTLGSIGLVRAMQGDNAQAMEYYGKSLAQFEVIGDKVGMARMLSYMGNIHYVQGDFELALESYQKSLVLRELMGDKANTANLHVGIGTVYLTQKNYTQALESYNKALAIFQALGTKLDVADTLTKVADTYLQQSDYSQTLIFAERAVALARQSEDRHVLWYSLVEVGKAERGLNQPFKASKAFEEAISIVESMRSQPPSSEPAAERTGLLAYLAEVELLISQNLTRDAFAYAERAKLQSLFEVIQSNSVKITKGMTREEQVQETKLANEVASLAVQYLREEQSANHEETRLATIKNRLARARGSFESFRKRLYALHPQLKIDRGEVTPMKLEEARPLITEQRAAVLEYLVTEDNTYLFVVTPAPGAPPRKIARKADLPSTVAAVSLKVYVLNVSGRQLGEQVTRFRQLLLRTDETFRQPARDLYDVLLKPAEQQLEGKTTLTIVPDGALWGLPFEALQPAEDQFLIEHSSISYAPSLSVLLELRKQRDRRSAGRAKTENLVAFGNPTINKDTAQRVEVTYKGERIGSSAQEEKEVLQLRTIYGPQGRIYTGTSAIEERAKNESGHAGILHFATRTILDDTSPMYSFIVLAPGDTLPVNDGLLHVWEIMNLHSEARLVVLPLSSMARGRIAVGGAALGLTWAWYVAGTPAIVLSRWETNSTGVTELMANFHTRIKPNTRLRSSVSKAEALRQSMLSLRNSEDYRHPYYWSGFAVMGDGR